MFPDLLNTDCSTVCVNDLDEIRCWIVFPDIKILLINVCRFVLVHSGHQIKRSTDMNTNLEFSDNKGHSVC